MIDRFEGQYKFLSNFYMSAFLDSDSNRWPSVEHYYQAMKTTDLKKRENIRILEKPSDAKKYGNNIELRNDWEQIKVYIMFEGLHMKFSQKRHLKLNLIKTFGHILIEGNFHHDNFWGDCLCSSCRNKNGYNILGQLLMNIRHIFKTTKEI